MNWAIEDLAKRIAGIDYAAAQQQLVNVYQMTKFLILDAIERVVKATPHRRPEQLYRLLSDVNRRYRQAEIAATKWVEKSIPEAFNAGVQVGVQQLEIQGISRLSTSFNLVNRGAVETLAKDTAGDLLRATRHTEERVKNRVREVVLDETRQMAATGVRAKEASKAIGERLADEGIFGIRDKRGRYIAMDEYARVVANVKLRDAHTQGTERLVMENGHDLVQVSTHLHRPDSCSPLEGKVYSLTGQTPGWPILTRHTPFHPNCRHCETPWVSTFRSDADVSKMQAESNRSGQITVYSQKSLDELEATQKKRARYMRVKRELRRQDEEAIAAGTKALPADAKAYERSLTGRANARVRRMEIQKENVASGEEPEKYPQPIGGRRRMRPPDKLVPEERTLMDLEIGSNHENTVRIPLYGFHEKSGEPAFITSALEELPVEHLRGIGGIRLTNNPIFVNGKEARACYAKDTAFIELSRVHRYWDGQRPAKSLAAKGTLSHEVGHHWFEKHAPPGFKVEVEELAKLRGVNNLNEFVAAGYSEFWVRPNALEESDSVIYNMFVKYAY